MNLLNIAKHLLYLTQSEYRSDSSTTVIGEIIAAERLFEVLKSFKNSTFSEVYTYDTLEFGDEYDEITDEGENDDDDDDDYDENEQSDLKKSNICIILQGLDNISKRMAQD